jgi:hypothetical protein
MHIPPYFKKVSWQRFLSGTFIGAILSFCIFLYMHGELYETWVEERAKLESKINDLELLLEDTKEKDEQSEKRIQVKEIDIIIEDEKKLKLDDLSVYQLKEMVKGEMKHVVGKDTRTISENYRLLISTIENKLYEIDDFKYKLKVKVLAITQKLRIVVSVDIPS